MRIRDSIAERLEACGLYRRAASRWIEVMQRCLDDEDRECTLGPHRPGNAASPQSIWMPPDGRARMPLTAQQYCPLFSSTSLL